VRRELVVAEMSGKIRIVLVDDHAIEREGIRELLSHEPDFEVVAEACDGLEAVELASRHRPDVIVTETLMPRMNGLEATHQILRRCPDTRVLVLSRSDREDSVLQLIQAGAAGYLLKTVTCSELVKAVRDVCGGAHVLYPQALGAVLGDYLRRVENPAAQADDDPLTPREREVLKLIAEGNSNQEIACILCLSRKTIETHRANIMEKLELHRVTDLVKFALRKGLISLD
jgi:DNA-binding NarL/FixJ family response regulator